MPRPCVLTVSVVLTLALTSVAQTQTPPPKPPYLDPSLPIERRVDDLVSRMTLAEKVSQLVNDAPAIERLGVPSYEWWNECLHGVARAGPATVFPQAIGMAASFDTALMHEVATVISDEARAKHHEFVRKGDRGHRRQGDEGRRPGGGESGAGVLHREPHCRRARPRRDRWGRPGVRPERGQSGPEPMSAPTPCQEKPPRLQELPGPSAES